MEKTQNYLLVDDDPTHNFICEYNIKKFDEEAEIKSFTRPEEAILWIEEDFPVEINEPTILFLDVNMPSISGWEFLELMEKLDTDITEKFHVFILTSSIEDFSDKQLRFPKIKKILSKPIKKNHLEEVHDLLLRPLPNS